MRIPPQRLLPLLRRAAEMRVVGHTWRHIGDILHRSANTVKGWPNDYPEYWAELTGRARLDRREEAGDQALSVLQRLMGSKDEKIQKDAAKELLDLIQRTIPAVPAAPKSEFHHIADHLASLTHDQRHQLLDRELARRAGPAAHAAGGPDGPASA